MFVSYKSKLKYSTYSGNVIARIIKQNEHIVPYKILLPTYR